MTPDIATPTLEHIADFSLQVAPPTEVGVTPLGQRRVIPILSGTVRGPRLNGHVVPGGADFQLIRHAGGDDVTTADIEARYVLETHDGARIYIVNAGVRSGHASVIARLNRGEQVDPAEIYFRTAPRFETAAPQYRWLMQHLFVASGARFPDRVELRYFMVR
ncbi:MULTISPECIES: DUF3237 domain-containing protein [unclassified Cupriavidus]|uniref:DUF3237 domain-containing protein n=1 Tax=unclassified Cupriavidus TaxID=2640874 RepID=UPI0010F49B47|nr:MULTISPECIES: DUF3237 domain-containing protein [unclassified Cupriavidus]MWL90592.1 DUF3237 family protein [Cupriavidus sp. SW-Y-13]